MRAPVVVALVIGASMLAPADAQAKPKKVYEILSKAGRSAVVRGPKTINSKTKKDLEALMEQLAAQTGGRAYAVILPGGAGTQKYAKIYDKLGLGPKDILIVSNGKKWSLRCDGISKSEKRELMNGAMAAGGDPLGRMRRLVSGLPAALNASQAASATAQADDEVSHVETDSPSEPSPWGSALFLVFVAGGVGLVIFRRKRRDAAIEADFKAALDPVETKLTELYLSLDGLEEREGFNALISAATQISADVDALKAETPSRESIAKLARLSSDAAGLHLKRSALLASEADA